MAPQAESTSTYISDQASSIEAWIWPVTAAIVVSGSLVFWSLAGMFWLATHPVRQSTVIWMPPAATHVADEEQPVATHATNALENRHHARTN